MSKPIETRAEFQDLAETRLEEAKRLLDIGKWDGTYYLAGYAVELALKACIIKSMMTTDAFPAKDFSKDCETHAYLRLLRAARLEPEWELMCQAEKQFAANWAHVSEWSEAMRYFRIEEAEARDFYDAVSEPLHGVLPWIKARW